ncbi:MAG: glycosyltransferase, partial [Clostridia bacterium]|nr:glycosyltransferase [Clostridia bacterium]
METIKIGSTVPVVKPLQNLLTRLGLYQHSIDGIYGFFTEKAIIAYQESKHLKSDGIVGPITWKSFDDPSNPYIPYTIRSGDTLREISKKYSTTVNEIVLTNPEVNLESLIPNEIIIIPLKTIDLDTIKINVSDTIETDQENIMQGLENPIICELPLVSILLPVYNHAHFLKQTIGSVQNQSYTNWELIIIDDGSTDDTPEVLKQYETDYRIQIYHQPNQKVPRTLTHLHTLVKGQLITWISSDNYMAPTMLEELVKYLIQYPDISMVYADPALIKENGEYLHENGYRDQNRDRERPYILRLPQDTESLGSEFDNYINACFLYKRDEAVAMAGHYFEDLNGMEDYDFWLRLIKGGKIHHINNQKPLYYYRVHDKSLSNQIQEKHLSDYQERSEKLLALDKQRTEYASKPWMVKMSRKAKRYLKQHPKLFKFLNQYKWQVTDKKIHFVCPNETVSLKDGQCFVRLYQDRFDLYKYKDYDYQLIASIEFGNEMDALALKARYTHTDNPFWEFPSSYKKKIIGIHLPLSYIDVDKTIKIMKIYEDYFFILTDTLENSSVKNAKLITEAVTNCAFIGMKEMGKDYWMYSGLDCMLVPPLLESSHCYSIINKSCLLSWSIGKWLLIPSDLQDGKVLPFVYAYDSNFYFPDVSKFNNPVHHKEVLNRYLESHSYTGRIKKLFSLCNLATQDKAVKRPNFSFDIHKEDVLPVKSEPALSRDLTFKGWIGLCIDALDEGGSEQVVAFLAKAFRSRGINVKILCTQRDGSIANYLVQQNFDVRIYHGDSEVFRKDLIQDPPLIVNTHNTKHFLDILLDLNIPIVESIEDMYIYFSEEDWQEEKIRSRCFNQVIAASNYVKTYYLMKNDAVSEQQIVLIENAGDPSRCSGRERIFTRNFLNIGSNDFVFLSIASIDGRKNQLGMMTAYDSFYNHYSKDSKFIFSGHIFDPNYYYEMLAYRENLNSKNNILILPYANDKPGMDVGSLYQASDLFVLDSYFEGWSTTA